MINTADLRLEDEILPLFDYTFNFFSGKIVRDIINEPLGSIEEILERQKILKGFVANRPVLKEYSYSRFNLSELYDFLENFPGEAKSVAGLRWQLIFSEKKRYQLRGKMVQLTLLFHKLYTTFLCRINIAVFPPVYQAELKHLNKFFTDLRLDHYESAFRLQQFRVKHIAELTKLITDKIKTGEAAAFWQRWFLFEAYLSVSNGIARNSLCFPVFDNSIFAIEGLYHPLLKKPVRNNVSVNKNVILLTGPNMSGKSTFLKAVSLCVYLAHTGLAVPAAKAVMPFFNTISVAINLTDSIVSGYSHFMTEVITLKNVVVEAAGNKKCFAVFDELFRGTNIEDALEISTSTIKGLTRFPNSVFFISTHLHQLKDIEEIKNNQVSTWFIDCELHNNLPVFNYELKEGWSDLKLGKILFEKEGLNKMLE